MKVIITAKELVDGGFWKEFCWMRKMDTNVLKEGAIEQDTEFFLSYQEAADIGVIHDRRRH